jgi:hypothetical protein
MAVIHLAHADESDPDAVIRFRLRRPEVARQKHRRHARRERGFQEGAAGELIAGIHGKAVGRG